MPKKISALNIVLNATVAPFAAGLKRVTGIIGGFTSGITSAGSSLLKFTGLGGALTAALGGAGLGLLIKDQMSAIGSTTKLANRFGISTEALSGFQHAAYMAGVDSQQLTIG